MSVASFVAAQRTEHGCPTRSAAGGLGVSESWFYKWHDRAPTARQARRAALDAAVKRRSTTPARRTTGRPGCSRTSRGRLEGVGQHGGGVDGPPGSGGPADEAPACLTRPDKAAAPIPDLVNRDFSAAGDQRWCGDLTEIPTEEGKLYLATVVDLASRRLPGFAMSEHHDSAVAKAALCMAAAVRGGDVAGVIFHSDKGGEYVGDLFAPACAASGGDPVDGPGRLGAGQRRRRRASTRPSSTSCSRAALRHQGPGPPEVARFIDAYNHPPPQLLRDAVAGRLRGGPRRASRRKRTDGEAA